jgi:DNA-binding HxlR family transcriptional regulator
VDGGCRAVVGDGGGGYDGQICSIARALEVVGERWSLLIVRDASFGLRRFHQFQQSLGIARNILSDRLNRLVDSGVLERVPARDHADRFEYQLTAVGRELVPALIALMHWGDHYLAGHGPPRIAEHAGCGGELVEQLICRRCQAMVPSDQAQTRPGPGLSAAYPS